MKQFDVPAFYRSPLIARIKQARKSQDKLKKDFTPTSIHVGDIHFLLARHFGFCYGVENAIEIAFRTLAENPGKRIYLLSEMIHNPQVNADLQEAGIVFLQDTYGKQLIPFESLQADDIVLIPAFGTTIDIEQKLADIGISTEKYNTTCPFVEKVWNRSQQIAKKNYSVVIHGKPKHEETRATFSHAAADAPAVIVNDMEDAIALGKYITGESDPETFEERFKGMYSPGFNVRTDLQRFGVVNQTTQLASDTQAIAAYLKSCLQKHHQLDEAQIEERFADTRDTLCYATLDNQTAVKGMLEVEADLAIVVGGYNSSNTTHLVELCEQKLPTYFISDASKLISPNTIAHFDYHSKEVRIIQDYLPKKKPVRILVTSGASCPDAIVEQVMKTLAAFYGINEDILETAALA
jgi:4-hydroxy-3-methylbut-2-en-1-yl diphosphate reductase